MSKNPQINAFIYEHALIDSRLECVNGVSIWLAFDLL